jgi:hypothetical protein
MQKYYKEVLKQDIKDHIYCVMVFSVLASSAADVDSSPGRVKPKTIQFVFVASPEHASFIVQ